jgi:predicted HTH domain antitoxin
LAPRDREARLLLELAAALHASDALSLRQAAELAGLSRIDFGFELGERGIHRHYAQEELAEDLAYASDAGGQ